MLVFFFISAQIKMLLLPQAVALENFLPKETGGWKLARTQTSSEKVSLEFLS